MLGDARVGEPSAAWAASVFHSDVAPAEVTPCQAFVVVVLIVARTAKGVVAAVVGQHDRRVQGERDHVPAGGTGSRHRPQLGIDCPAVAAFVCLRAVRDAPKHATPAAAFDELTTAI